MLAEVMQGRKSSVVAFCLVAIVLVGILYGHILHSPFQFDDHELIIQNQAIKDITDLKRIASGYYSKLHFVTMYTFALNYHFGKADTFGYHMVNVVIHLINSILVFLLVRIILQIQNGKKYGPQLSAWATALVYCAHPLQTQSVTYVWARSELLSAFFGFCAVIFYLRFRLDRKPRHLIFCFSAFIVGLFSRGTLIIFPGIVMLIEGVFFYDLSSIRAIAEWNKKKIIFGVIFLSGIGILLVLFRKTLGIEWLFDAQDIPRGLYFLTQLRVVVTYIRLFFVPVGQNLDYFFPLSHSIFEIPTFVSAIGLLLLFVTAVRFYAQDRIITFCIMWFFICLLPVSSFLPLTTVISESRVYFPLFGLAFFVGHLLSSFRSRKIGITLLALIIIILGFFTYRRNVLWRSPIALMEDTVQKSPYAARPHQILGVLYSMDGQQDNAYAMFSRAIELAPGYPEPHNNLGVIYLNNGVFDKAIVEFETAISLRESFIVPYINLARVYILLNKFSVARMYLDRASRVNPNNQSAYYFLGYLARLEKEYEAAIQYLEKALDVRPDFVSALVELGLVYGEKGEYARAEEFFTRALQIAPERIDIIGYREQVKKLMGKE